MSRRSASGSRGSRRSSKGKAAASPTADLYALPAELTAEQQASLAEAYEHDNIRGKAKSKTEDWAYQRAEGGSGGGIVTCTSGTWAMEHRWNGHQLINEAGGKEAASGWGWWDGKTLRWFLPHQDRAFVVYQYDKDEGMYTMVPGGPMEGPNFKLKGNAVKPKPTASTQYQARFNLIAPCYKMELVGDWPQPLGMLITLFTHMQAIRTMLVMRGTRKAKRCGKLVVDEASASKPMLCSFCVADGDVCFICGNGLGGPSGRNDSCLCGEHTDLGSNTCAKCGDNFGDPPTPAYTCRSCRFKGASDCSYIVHE